MATVFPAHTRPPMERRWLGLDRRYLVPSLAVVLVALLWSVLLPAIDDAISSRAVASGTTITLNREVSFTVTSDWVVRGELLGDRPAALSVFRDGVVFTVRSGAFGGDADALLTALISQQDTFTVNGQRRDAPQAQGYDGVAASITGTDFTGGLFAFVQPAPSTADAAVGAGGTGVTITVSGRPDVLNPLTDDIARMIASLRFPDRRGAA